MRNSWRVPLHQVKGDPEGRQELSTPFPSLPEGESRGRKGDQLRAGKGGGGGGEGGVHASLGEGVGMSNVRTDLPSSDSGRGRSVPNVWERDPAALPVYCMVPDIPVMETTLGKILEGPPALSSISWPSGA